MEKKIIVSYLKKISRARIQMTTMMKEIIYFPKLIVKVIMHDNNNNILICNVISGYWIISRKPVVQYMLTKSRPINRFRYPL